MPFFSSRPSTIINTSVQRQLPLLMLSSRLLWPKQVCVFSWILLTRVPLHYLYRRPLRFVVTGSPLTRSVLALQEAMAPPGVKFIDVY